MKKIKISEEDLREAVKSATKKLMRGQVGWRKNQDLATIEWAIEYGIREELTKRHGKFIEIQ